MSHLRIGISANFFYPDPDRKFYGKKTLAFLEQGMCDFFAAAGAIPYMIPKISGKVTSRDAVAEMDGIIFAGGADLCPRSYGEEPLKPEWEGDAARDDYEIALFHTAHELKKPILGICRGLQLINVALGGTLYQDIATQIDTETTHRCAHAYDNLKHEIDITPDTALSYIYEGRETAIVNSVHHQAVHKLGKGLKVQAVSSTDGVIESFWLDEPDSHVMAVQWHPEFARHETKADADALLTHYLNTVQSCKSA